MASIFDGLGSYFGLDRYEPETFGEPPTDQEMADRMVADHSAQGRNVNVTVNPDPEALGGPFVYSGPDSFKAAVGDIGQDLYGAYNSVPGRITRAASSLFSPASAASYLTGQVAQGVYDSATKGKVTPGEFGPLGNPVSRYTPEEVASGTRNYMGVGEFGPPANNRPAPSANNRPAYLSDMYDPHAGLGPTATVNYPTADAFISALGKDVVSPAYTALTNSLINPAQNFVVDNVVGPAQNVVDNVVGPLTSGLGSLFTGFQTAAGDVVDYIADALGISKNDVTQEHVDQVNASQLGDYSQLGVENQRDKSFSELTSTQGKSRPGQQFAELGRIGPRGQYDFNDYGHMPGPAPSYKSIADFLDDLFNVPEPEVTQAQIDRITSRPDLPDEPNYSPALNLAAANKVTPGPLSTTESGRYLVEQARAREQANNLAADFEAALALGPADGFDTSTGYTDETVAPTADEAAAYAASVAEGPDHDPGPDQSDFADDPDFWADGGMVNRDGFSVDPTTGEMTIDPTTAIAGWVDEDEGSSFDQQAFLRDAYVRNAPEDVLGLSRRRRRRRRRRQTTMIPEFPRGSQRRLLSHL